MMRKEPIETFDKYARDYRKLHMESIKASGEDPDYFSAYKARFISDYMKQRNVPTPSSLLDFGCGIGGSIKNLIPIFPSTSFHGVDVSSESIAMAKEATPGVRFDVIKGEQLPCEQANYDAAVAACVYHHIAPEKRAAWTREIFAALKPGGVFFIFEHNPLNPLTIKAVKDCPFDEDAILLKRQESQLLMKSAGFVSVTCSFIVFFPKALAKFRTLEKHLARLPLGAQYAVIGLKPVCPRLE